MINPKQDRIRDRKYLDWLHDQPCVLSGNPSGNDPAHIRYGCFSGGMKPSDDLVLPLRHDLHTMQDRGELSFWRTQLSMGTLYSDNLMMDALKALAEKRYQEYLGMSVERDT